MAVPHEIYVRFLASKGLNELPKVNEALGAISLPPIDQKALESQLAALDAVLPSGVSEQIEKKDFKEDFLQWMEVLDLRELWLAEKPWQDPDIRPAVKLIFDVHQDTVLRKTLNSLLIKGMKAKDLAQTLGAKFATLLKEEHVDLYSKVFFNPARMARADWRQYLRLVPDTEARAYAIALSEPLDVLKIELELPSKVSVSETLQWLLSKSYSKARTFMEINTPEANREAREWIEQVVKLTDKYEKYRSGDQDDFAKNLQMEFHFIDTPFEEPDGDLLKEVADRLKNKVLAEDEAKEPTADKDPIFEQAGEE